MKSVLLITYYWPPAGGVAVQRWLKFARHLDRMGWTLTVCTAANAHYPAYDEALSAQVPADITVIKVPITEPGAWYDAVRKKMGRPAGAQTISRGEKTSFFQRAAIFIRSNFFIPDARMLWVSPVTKTLKKYLAEHPVDVLVSNGTPHSVHLIALNLKKAYPHLPWIADFRDPWTGIDYFENLYLTPWARHKHRRLEKQVLQTADKVITVSPQWAKDLGRIAGRDDDVVITNGYEETDFRKMAAAELDTSFSLLHAGSLGKDRDMPALWAALREMAEGDPVFRDRLRIKLIGRVDQQVKESIRENGLEGFTDYVAFLPHHEVIRAMQQAQLLLLPVNRGKDAPGRIPAKLFEYLRADRPILAFSSVEGDAVDIIRQTRAGWSFNYQEKEPVKAQITEAFKKYLAGGLSSTARYIEQYSRRQLAERLKDLMNKLIADTHQG